MSKVWIEHPDLGPESRNRQDARAFEQIWSKKGWVLVEEARAGETVAELRAEASEAKIKGRSSMDKEELVTALEEEDSKNQPED